MGKTTDSRARGFVERHGKLVQVELDALPPDVLQRLYGEAIAIYWDEDAHATAVEQEHDDALQLGASS